MLFWFKNAPGLRLLWQIMAYLRHNGPRGLVGHIKQQRCFWRAFPGWRAPASAFSQSEEERQGWLETKQAAGTPVTVLVLAQGLPRREITKTLHSLANQTLQPNHVVVYGAATPGKSKGNVAWCPQGEDIHALLANANKESCLLVVQGPLALHPCAISAFAQTLRQRPGLVYSDDEWYGKNIGHIIGRRYKAGFGPDTLNGYNYVGGCFALQAGLALQAENFVPQTAYDMLLRFTRPGGAVTRLAQALYRVPWPGGVAAGQPQQEAQAVQAHLARLGVSGSVEQQPLNPALRRVRYAIQGQPMVSIIIQNKNQGQMLRRCVQSILQKTSWPAFEVCVIENGSDAPETFAVYDELQQDKRVRLLHWQNPWNYAALNNYGAQQARGEMLLLLNNDVEILEPDWLQELLMYAQREDVGAVGALLLYANQTIQHAGVITGICGAARHAFVGAQPGQPGYEGRITTVQNLTAVTAACMLVKKEVYRQVGGFCEEFAVGNNDVDFCLKLRQKGYLNVYTPFCKLLHYESATREGNEKTGAALQKAQQEDALLQQRWPAVLKNEDPYYNPGLSAVDALFEKDGLGRVLRSHVAEGIGAAGR